MHSEPIDQIPLTRLKGVGPALEKKFNQLGIYNVQDLLFHVPLRYEDRTKISLIGKVNIGDQVQLQGEIVNSSIQFGRRRSLHCVIRDNTGFINLRFFHFSATQKEALRTGKQVRCFGEARRGRSGLEMYHPEYRILEDPENEPVADSLTPNYPTTEGLQQGRLRNVARQALEILEDSGQVQDYLPPDLTHQLGLQSLTEAIKLIHRPPIDTALSWTTEAINPGQRRLAFEELLAHRLCMRRFRNDSKKQSAPQLQADDKLISRYLQNLPFTLTGGQQKAYQQIAQDLASLCPMLRLLQGDVGSGKTVVAALSALHAIGSGYQATLMAPTEILAEQHYRTLGVMLLQAEVKILLLTGGGKAKIRKENIERIKQGEIDLVIGTHALIQEDVEFKKLGLIVIDEQHKFGVKQRIELSKKGGKKRMFK